MKHVEQIIQEHGGLAAVQTNYLRIENPPFMREQNGDAPPHPRPPRLLRRRLRLRFLPTAALLDELPRSDAEQ
jgi:hypothetical protein